MSEDEKNLDDNHDNVDLPLTKEDASQLTEIDGEHVLNVQKEYDNLNELLEKEKQKLYWHGLWT